MGSRNPIGLHTFCSAIYNLRHPTLILSYNKNGPPNKKIGLFHLFPGATWEEQTTTSPPNGRQKTQDHPRSPKGKSRSHHQQKH